MIKIINDKFDEEELQKICKELKIEFEDDIDKEELIKLVVENGLQEEVINYKRPADKKVEEESPIDLGDKKDIFIFEFSKPFVFEGKTFSEVEVNFADLNGKDMMNVTRELTSLGHASMLAETDKIYLSAIAAKAMKQPFEFMNYIPIKDFTSLTMKVQNFLL